MKLKPAALAIAACSLLPACGGRVPDEPTLAWTMYQNGTAHQGVVASAFPAVAWTRNLHSQINGGLAYDGASLFAVDFAGDLVALDPRTGRVFWNSRVDGVLMSTPIVAENKVFVGSGTSATLSETPGKTIWGRKRGDRWYAFRASDGRRVWSYRVVGEAMPSAAYDTGKLIFATGDNLATSVVAASGKPVWKAALPGVPTMASAMVHGGTVYLAATLGEAQHDNPQRSHTLALRTGDGSVRWSAPYGNADCTPTVAQGMVFVEGAHDGPLGRLEAVGSNDVVALDERTGVPRWRYRSPPGFFTDVASNERAIAGTYAGGVLYQSIPAIASMAAFRAADGRLLWIQRASAPVKMSPLVYRGSVYFGDTAGMLYKLDARDGALRSVRPYREPFSTSPPLIVGRTLFVAGGSVIYALPLDTL